MSVAREDTMVATMIYQKEIVSVLAIAIMWILLPSVGVLVMHENSPQTENSHTLHIIHSNHTWSIAG